MLRCPECGNSHVRVGARYCDECGSRLPPQVGLDPEATLPPTGFAAPGLGLGPPDPEPQPEPEPAPPRNLHSEETLLPSWSHRRVRPPPEMEDDDDLPPTRRVRTAEPEDHRRSPRRDAPAPPEPRTRSPRVVQASPRRAQSPVPAAPAPAEPTAASPLPEPASPPAAPRPVGGPGGPVADPPAWARGVGWEAWASAGPMPHRVRVDGEEWALVDEIDVRNRESEDAHLFRIEGTNHSYRERETHRYPGGSGIEGRGYRHEGGSVLFRVGNVMPDTPVVMVRQAWAHGAEHGKVRVDNRPVGAIRETEVDVRSPWRNRAFVIPADAVQREEISLEVDERGSERGLTWFHLWFYQPAEAADAYAAAAAVAGGAPVAYGGARAGPTVSSFSELRTVGRELPGSVIAEGRPWRLADQISFSDHAAVDAHDFRVVDSQGTYVGFKLALRFPDGSSAEEQGIRYDHGEATWQVSGLTPDKDVTLVFRTDVQRGHWAFDLSLDGAAVCRVRVDERDPVHRGRNWDVIVPGRFVTRSTARFRAAVSEPGRGVTFFRIWVYQAE